MREDDWIRRDEVKVFAMMGENATTSVVAAVNTERITAEEIFIFLM